MDAAQIIDLRKWYATAAGAHLRDWALRLHDQAVSDCFGYHALQLGCPHLPLLRSSRVQHRWLAATCAGELAGESSATAAAQQGGNATHVALALQPEALPFAENSLDLVLLPHTLEASADPHTTLREVARVLLPEGRLIVMGFHAGSLWGLQHKLSCAQQPFWGGVCAPIGYRRLRDWMRLLGLEVDRGRFGCYRPELRSASWFEHMAWMEKAGERWWPMLGGVYLIEAVKRVRGMRMIQPRWKLAVQPGAGVPVAQRNTQP